MKIFCDMDGVLVKQTGRDGFQKMPWMPDGKMLWEFIKPMNPTILSQLPDETWARCMPQKCEWVARELGKDIRVIVVQRSHGKAVYASPDAVLIDDAIYTHGKNWIAAGGVFVYHINAAESIKTLRKLMQ